MNRKNFNRLLLINLLIFVVFFLIKVITKPEIKFKINLKLGDKAYNSKLYNEAEYFYTKANKNAMRLNSNVLLLITYNRLAETKSVQKKYIAAESLLKKAISQASELNNKDKIYLARSLNGLGNIYFETDKLNKAKELFIKSSKIHLEVSGPYSIDYAFSLNNIGYTCLKMKLYTLAEKYLIESLIIKEKIYGRNSKKLLGTLTNLSELYQKIDKDKQKQIYILINKIKG